MDLGSPFDSDTDTSSDMAWLQVDQKRTSEGVLFGLTEWSSDVVFKGPMVLKVKVKVKVTIQSCITLISNPTKCKILYQQN